MPFWDFHIQRLKSGLDILEIESKLFDWNKLKEECTELLEMNNHDKGGKVRLSFYRSGEGSYFPNSNKAAYIMESFALENEKFTLNPKGVQIDFYLRVNIFSSGAFTPCGKPHCAGQRQMVRGSGGRT